MVTQAYIIIPVSDGIWWALSRARRARPAMSPYLLASKEDARTEAEVDDEVGMPLEQPAPQRPTLTIQQIGFKRLAFLSALALMVLLTTCFAVLEVAPRLHRMVHPSDVAPPSSPQSPPEWWHVAPRSEVPASWEPTIQSWRDHGCPDFEVRSSLPAEEPDRPFLIRNWLNASAAAAFRRELKEHVALAGDWPTPSHPYYKSRPEVYANITSERSWKLSFARFGEFGAPTTGPPPHNPTDLPNYGGPSCLRARPLPDAGKGAAWPEWVTRGLTRPGWDREKHAVAVTRRAWGIQYHRHPAVYNYHAGGSKMWWISGRAPPESLAHQSGSLWHNSCHEALDASADSTGRCFVEENSLLYVPHYWYHAVCSVGPEIGFGYVWTNPEAPPAAVEAELREHGLDPATGLRIAELPESWTTGRA